MNLSFKAQKICLLLSGAAVTAINLGVAYAFWPSPPVTLNLMVVGAILASIFFVWRTKPIELTEDDKRRLDKQIRERFELFKKEVEADGRYQVELEGPEELRKRMH